MSSKENIRQSNFELMRIVSMFMIVFGHVLAHGGVILTATYNSDMLFRIIMCFLVVHVNSFILLSGYFGHNKKLKVTKVIKLNNAMWFYTLLFVIIFKYFKMYDIGNIELFKAILPIPFNDYWFMTDYLILYIMSPALNCIINNTNQTDLRKILITGFVVFSVLPWLTGQEFFNVNGGSNIISFCFLYILGGYLNIYRIDDNIHLKNYSISKKKLIMISLYIIFCITNYMTHLLGVSLMQADSVTIRNVGENFALGLQHYSNPLVILATIAYFSYFSQLKIKNKIINKISSCTLGIYLIHDNIYVRQYIYKFLGFTKKIYYVNDIGMIFISAILIFSISFIIEFIRQLIFKFIYDKKFSCRFRKKCQDYFESLGWTIN